MQMYIVKYTGPFGFIKPFQATRDDTTFSQRFLAPSTVEGMVRKLGVTAILRHRISAVELVESQETTAAKGGLDVKKEAGVFKTNKGIIKRMVMVNPVLTLAFPTQDDAELAYSQHICLCRNEDLMMPTEISEVSESEFEVTPGFELLADTGTSPDSIFVGYNRYSNGNPMFGVLKIVN